MAKRLRIKIFRTDSRALLAAFYLYNRIKDEAPVLKLSISLYFTAIIVLYFFLLTWYTLYK